MSKFNELHEHLKECIDSNNDSFIGITEDGVEFNMYELAFGLSVQAKNENDRLVDFVKQVSSAQVSTKISEDKAGFATQSDVISYLYKEIADNLLKELGHEI